MKVTVDEKGVTIEAEGNFIHFVAEAGEILAALYNRANSIDADLGKVVKVLIQRMTADDGPIWDMPAGEGSYAVAIPKKMFDARTEEEENE